MAEDDGDNRSYAEELSKFLVDAMRLEDITLAVPNDLEAGTKGRDEGHYEWYMWTLHKALIEAFKGGQFHGIRLAHPEMYAEDISAYGFHNVEVYAEHVLPEEYRNLTQERRSLYWNRFYDAHFNGTVCGDTLDAVHESVRNIWHRAGYTVERDSSRTEENGTVLVIRRVVASMKRRHEEAGSAPEGKRAKTKKGKDNREEKNEGNK